jgi:2-polyprenyl-6-methoxyphenol hydroxylase-like FAD-dependent oxidoreductase
MIYDVVISGAGPVGLFLACELALAKCSVLILEKAENPHSPLKKLPFGIRGLSAPTIEALYRRDLLKDLKLHERLKNPHQNAVQGSRRQVGHFAGIPFHEGDVDSTKWKYRLLSSTPTSLISEMEELETVLSRRAESLGVEIRRGVAVTSFQQNENGVVIHSAELSLDQSLNQSFQGRWLVGCDGARSIVRKTGGFDFAGTEPEFTGYTTLLDIADPEKLRPGRNVTSRGMYMQSQPGFVIIQDFDGGAFHHSKKTITREHVQEVLRRISNTDVTIDALQVATMWTDRARQVTHYRNRRIFLAGDAAHIHSPLGGQGLNLGIGDATNLGWKLAATIHEKAVEGLLDTYQTERHPIGAQVLDWSRAQVAIMKTNPDARALHAMVRDLMNTRDGATYFAERVWGVSLHYDLGGNHPMIGHSVPNFKFENGKTIGEFMHDGQGVLLDFHGNARLKNLASECGGLINYVSGRANEQFGISALLIRPDGVIAWVAEGEAHEESLWQALALWFASGN